MRTILVSSLAAAILVSAIRAGDKTPPGTRPVSTADTVLSIYILEGWVAKPAGPQLVLAAWKDGRVVWSENRKTGGAPFRAAHIPPKQIGDLLARIGANGFYDEPDLNLLRIAYDAGSVVILAKSGKKQIRMQSIHELYRTDDPTTSEVSGRPGSWKNEMDTKWRYYMAWDDLRAKLTSIIPANGEPIEGKLFHEAGECFGLTVERRDNIEEMIAVSDRR